MQFLIFSMAKKLLQRKMKQLQYVVLIDNILCAATGHFQYPCIYNFLNSNSRYYLRSTIPGL